MTLARRTIFTLSPGSFEEVVIYETLKYIWPL